VPSPKPKPRGATTPQVRQALQDLRETLSKPSPTGAEELLAQIGGLSPDSPTPRTTGTESPRGNVPPKRQRPPQRPPPQRPPQSVAQELVGDISPADLLRAPKGSSVGRPSFGQDSQNKPSSLADSLTLEPALVPEPEVEQGQNPFAVLPVSSPTPSPTPEQKAEALKTKLEARQQYFTQLRGQAKGNVKKQIRKDATTYPALEILQRFNRPSWIHPRAKGKQFTNAPIEKGVYRFYSLGSADGKGNTKKFNLHRDPTGKTQGEGDIKDFQLDLHSHPEHFEKLIREQKIRFKDVDEGE